MMAMMNAVKRSKMVLFEDFASRLECLGGMVGSLIDKKDNQSVESRYYICVDWVYRLLSKREHD
jgi:hypothetical protein